MSHHPEVKWAEREDKVFLTVLLPDAKDADVKLDPEGVFNFSAKAGPENQLYELKLELNDKVNIEESKINNGLRSIFCILEKAEPKWWNKLLRGGKPPHYVKVDWDKWVDEDEDEDAGTASLNIAGRGNDGDRKRKAVEGGCADPSKKRLPSTNRPPNTNRPGSTPAPVSHMRSLLDRSYEANERTVAERGKDRGAVEKESISSELRSTVSLGKDRTVQRSQDKSPEGLPDPPEQRTESREIISTPPFRMVGMEKDQVVAEKGDSSSAKDLASSEVDLALVEKSPTLDKEKAVDTGDDHPSAGEGDATDLVQTNHLFDSSSARGNFLQFRYDGPDRLCKDKVACSELIYSVRGSEAPYPDLEGLAQKKKYERFARAQVKCLVLANEVVARYDYELAKARKEAEKEKDESARLRAHVEELKESNERLKESNERLKNRLRYLKEITVPSGKVTQIRGTLKILEQLREKMKIDIPRNLTDRMARDLESQRDELKKIAVVELDDEELL